MNVTMPKSLWNAIIDMIEKRLSTETLKKPIVIALYTTEDNRYEVRDCASVCVQIAKRDCVRADALRPMTLTSPGTGRSH